MTVQLKTALVLLGTFLLGGVLGALLLGSIRGERESARHEMGRPAGGARHLVERVIRPRDEEQREAIRGVLLKWRERHRALLSETHLQLRQGFDSMRAELDPLLEEDQRQRLARESERLERRALRGGPPGGDAPRRRSRE